VAVVISPASTSRICNDKWESYKFFASANLPTPKTWLPENLPPVEELSFPLFLKPRAGRGSVNTFRLRNEKELGFFLSYVKDPIVQEYLEGEEYTLDTFVDFEGNVISVVPRHRLWIRSGVMDKGRAELKRNLIDLGAETARKLNIVGPSNIQVKHTNDSPKIIEVNPRFSGGIALTIKSGADFPRWVVQAVLGEKLEPRLGNFIHGMVMMSFEESIFRQVDIEGFDEIKRLIT
jgi:carbamoyl-phosphate synthase large subunit